MIAHSNSFWRAEDPLILGSASTARRALLEAAMIPVEIVKPQVNEKAIAASLLETRHSPAQIAIALAHAKAEAISLKKPGRLILSADQTLDLDGSLLMKPVDLTSAENQLRRLRNRAHDLHAAAVLRRGPNVLWAGYSSARLQMRDFSDAFLAHYLANRSTSLLDQVGCYQIESLGCQLFSSFEGEFAAILGLPLSGILHALRDHDLLLS
jgi:septum formation protein